MGCLINGFSAVWLQLFLFCDSMNLLRLMLLLGSNLVSYHYPLSCLDP